MDTPSNPLQQSSLSELRRRKSTKWRTFPADVLPLFIAELDVPLAAPVADALHAAVDLSDTGYAMGWGDAEYAAALDGFARRHWDWRIPAERTALVPDVMLGIVEVLKLVTAPGDAVVVNPPVYPPFYAFVTTMDRRVVEAPLTPEGRLDPRTLDATFRDAAAYLLCSPHNPTGAVHTVDELTAVTELADRHGVRVVADEIHAPLVLPGARFVPYLSLPGTERGFSLLSASKAWNLAGLKAALAVAGADAADDLARMPEVVSHGPSHFGVIAHAAAFRHGDDWLAGLLTGLDENRRLLAELLKEQLPQVGYRGHEGTYLAWLDCRDLGLGDDPAEVFLDRGRVALGQGPFFGTGGAGHVRLNLGTTPEILEEAVRRMAAAV